MQEYQVTVNGVRFELERPLFVLATQNPIEQEGTYPLPEAQLDRFMFNVVIDYPSAEEERRILAATTGTDDPQIAVVAVGRRDRAAALGRARSAGGGERHRLRERGWCARPGRPARRRMGRRSSCARGCAGAPGRAPARRCCSAAKALALLEGRSVVVARGHPRGGAAGAAAPHSRELPGRGRRRRRRSDRRAAARHGAPLRRVERRAPLAEAVPTAIHARSRRPDRAAATSNWSPASPSTARSRVCTAAPSTATARSSASTGTIVPATISSTSTGSCSRGPIALYTKQYRETTNLAAQLVVDASAIDGVCRARRRRRSSSTRGSSRRRWRI